MKARKIRWPMVGQRERHLPAADDVLQLCTKLTDRFRGSSAFMPIVVLQAEQPPDEHGTARPAAPPPGTLEAKRVATLVSDLHAIYAAGRLLCQKLPVPGDQPRPRPDDPLREYDAALAIVRTLSSADAWDNAGRSRYRRYSFPRSELLAAIEAAASPGPADPDTVVARLREARWPSAKAGRRALPTVRTLFESPAPLIGSILSTAAAKLITPLPTAWVPPTLVALTLVIWLVPPAWRSIASPLSWISPASPWFTTSTFILLDDEVPPDNEPVPLWRRLTARLPSRGREDRARTIVSQFTAASYEAPVARDVDGGREREMKLYLWLRVHALLEDLRANYRPRSLDLRRLKRTWPPLVFLPAADRLPGGILFMQAVSDLRSRRSEADPMLIVAGIGETLPDFPSAALGDGNQSVYEQWIRRLRMEQSPSVGSKWPWVLRQPVWTDHLTGQSHRDPDQPRARWSAWRLWSLWTVLGAVLLLVVGGLWRDHVVAGQDCGGGLLNYDAALVTVHHPRADAECIGIDTKGGIAFVPADGGTRLSFANGQSPDPAESTDLASLEGLINQQNQLALTGGSYVTFVYAGALTAPEGNPADPQSAAEELAGVYAWQYQVNTSDNAAGQAKIRVEVANDGFNSGYEQLMADKIAAAANQDRTIVGVIGLGADTVQSDAAVGDLAAADLVVVDTTNSDDNLPRANWNYFGLSPTNGEEAADLRQYAGSGNGRYAVIFERQGDPYSSQQATGAEQMLAKAGFRLACGHPLIYPANGSPAITDPNAPGLCHVRPSVVYLAGRHEDLAPLAGPNGLIASSAGDFADSVTVLSGDDMTAIESAAKLNPLAPNTTLYYVAQTDPAHVAGTNDNGSGLNVEVRDAFALRAAPSYDDPVFADGLLALGFDAADALYN
jgi:hypothetical protein